MRRRPRPQPGWLHRLGLAGVVVLSTSCAAALLLAAVNPRLVMALGYARPPTRYVVPVAGVAAAALRSTWGAPRSGGRRHRGADIFAKRGTPVVSAVDGVVWRVGTNPLGGKVIWIVGEGGAAYYYAHLDTWRPGLRAGDRVVAGGLLGTVGNTGNARTTPAHLHFAVEPITLFGISAIDPVPVLRDARTVSPAEALANVRDDGLSPVAHRIPSS